MADMKTIADLLVLNNKKLDQLTKDNEKSDSVTSIIAHSLPEILSDQQIAGRQEKFDKREGVTEVDEFVVTNTDAVNKLGSEYLSKLIPQIKTSAAASTKSINSAFLQFNNRTAASAILAQRGYSKSLTVFGNALTVDDIDKRKLEKEEFEKNISERKNELEKLGIIATDNLGFNKLQYESDKAELRFRLKTAESPAKKKEIKEDLRKLNKDQGSRLQKIGAGIGNLVESGKKGAKLGIKAFFTTIGLGALMIALGTFFQSKTFKLLTDSLQGLIQVFTGRDKDGNPISLFRRITGIFTDGGPLGIAIAGVLALFTVATVGKMFAPLSLLSIGLRKAFGAIFPSAAAKAAKAAKVAAAKAAQTAAKTAAQTAAAATKTAAQTAAAATKTAVKTAVKTAAATTKTAANIAIAATKTAATAAQIAAKRVTNTATKTAVKAATAPAAAAAAAAKPVLNSAGRLINPVTGRFVKGPAAVASKVASAAAPSIAKVGGKALLKGAIRAVPGIGLLAGLLFAGQRALAGDFVGAGMEIAAGAAGLLPVVGTGFSLAISAGLAASDLGAFDSAPEKLSTGASSTAKGLSPIDRRREMAKRLEDEHAAALAAGPYSDEARAARRRLRHRAILEGPAKDSDPIQKQPPMPEKSNKLSTGASAAAKGSSLPKAPSLAPVRGTLASGDVVTLPDGTMVTKDDPRRVKDSVVAHLPEAERADAKKAVILSKNLDMRMNDLRTLYNEAGRKAKKFEESGLNIGAELERIEQKRLIGKFNKVRATALELEKEFALKPDAPKVAPKVGTGMPMSMPTGSDLTGVNKATGSANAATPTNLFKKFAAMNKPKKVNVSPKTVGTGMPMSMPSGVASSAGTGMPMNLSTGASPTGTGMPMSMPSGSDPTGVNKATDSANAATPTNLSTGASPTGKGKSGVASSGLAKKLAEIQAKRKALQSKRKAFQSGQLVKTNTAFKSMDAVGGGRDRGMMSSAEQEEYDKFAEIGRSAWEKGKASFDQGKIESADLMRQENQIKLMMDAGQQKNAGSQNAPQIVNNVNAPNVKKITTTGSSGQSTLKNNKLTCINGPTYGSIGL